MAVSDFFNAVFDPDQLALFDCNNTFNGRPLIRGAIMDSGSITPTEPVNVVKAQAIFDMVVEAAGCASAADSAKLDCLSVTISS